MSEELTRMAAWRIRSGGYVDGLPNREDRVLRAAQAFQGAFPRPEHSGVS